MSDTEDSPDNFFRKKGEAILVEAKLSPEKEDQLKKSIRKKTYFGGTIGVLLIMLISPIALFVIHFSCYKNTCSIGDWYQEEWKMSEIFYGFRLYFLFTMCVLVFGHLPIGQIKLGEPMLSGDIEKHRLIGLKYMIGLLPFVFLGASQFFNEGDVSWSDFRFHDITNNLHYNMIAATFFSFFLSLWLYKRSLRAPASTLNIHANTGSFIYDFFMGRQVSPRVLGFINIKSVIIYMSYASTIALIAGYGYETVFRNEKFYTSPTLLIMIYSKTLWALDYVTFDENYLTSQTVKHDGCGFWFIFSKLVIYPMLMTLPERFTVIHQYEIDSEPFMIFTFIFINACAIWHRFTTADKALFTRDKDHPEVLAYNYIQAANGKRLLVDGWWNGCRHPTYLCAICSALACAAVTAFSGVIPYTFFAFQLVYLIHRIERNEDLCRYEYGEAWEVYCQKVPYKLLKYIY